MVGRFIDAPNAEEETSVQRPDYSTDSRGRMGMGQSSLTPDSQQSEGSQRPPKPQQGDVGDMNTSAQQTDSELKKQMQQQTQESKSLREQMAEQNERMLNVLEQINGNSAATAANSGGNSEDKVFLRKDQQFTFEGSPL